MTMQGMMSRARSWFVGCAGLAIALSPVAALAQSTDPIKIGVIGEESSVAGASLTKAAAMAANDIPTAASTAARFR
jgi:branched-chain amino acid transport system substrate-binding protein